MDSHLRAEQLAALPFELRALEARTFETAMFAERRPQVRAFKPCIPCLLAVVGWARFDRVCVNLGRFFGLDAAYQVQGCQGLCVSIASCRAPHCVSSSCVFRGRLSRLGWRRSQTHSRRLRPPWSGRRPRPLPQSRGGRCAAPIEKRPEADWSNETSGKKPNTARTALCWWLCSETKAGSSEGSVQRALH